MNKRVAIGVLLILVMTAGCSSSTEPNTGGGEIITTTGIRAEMGSNTVFIPENIVESGLTEADPEAGRYSFSADVLSSGGITLETGEILLIAGVGLGRITSVQQTGGQVNVQTGFASINEAFREADIEWEREFELTPDIIANSQVEIEGGLFPVYSVTGGVFQWKISSGPYSGTASIAPKGSSATIVVVLTKQEGNTSAGFRAETTIRQVANYTNLEIRDHKTRKFAFRNPNMGGEVELRLASAGGGFDQNIGIGPLVMIKIPFNIGPIPVMLVVKVRTVASISVIGNSSVIADTKFSYSGSAGLSYDGTTLSTDFDSAIANPNHQGGTGDLAALIGVNVNAQWGFAAPEVELQMFGNTVVPYLRPEFFLRANLSWGPVCQSISAEYQVKAGLDVRFLGIASTNIYEKDVVPKKEWKAFSPQSCADKRADNQYLIFPVL
ncbi:MAG: hypothetical protein JJU37_13965 [Balneolaceae bacterium]|nr:hypothetical protein [Balneolaceae bacterium]